MDSCLACQRIALIKAGKNPFFIKELSQSYAVLADHQYFGGWAILLLKEHHEHLAGLPSVQQAQLYEDVMAVADAINATLSPKRLNYECLGNTLNHVHWHVVPRYGTDEAPTQPIWIIPKDVREVTLSDKRRSELIELLRDEL